MVWGLTKLAGQPGAEMQLLLQALAEQATPSLQGSAVTLQQLLHIVQGYVAPPRSVCHWTPNGIGPMNIFRSQPIG